MRNCVLGLLMTALLLGSPAPGQELSPNPRLPAGYHQWTLTRPDGSALVFFATFDKLDPGRPLAVWMQGSGAYSLFPMRDGQIRPGPMSLIHQALGDDVQVLSVEKRGVEFGKRGQGGALEAGQEYQSYATLEDRAADVELVLSAFEKGDGLPDRLLAIGHSEGADVAARVAADTPQITHLAFLAGGGPSQLFDFLTLIRKSQKSEQEKDAEIEALWQSWREIQSDPRSTVKMFQGHAYRRWSSYISHPPLESLLKTRARILIVHGSLDTAVPIESADLSSVELDRAGREFQYLRLPGADHSLRTPGQIEANSPPFLPLGFVLRKFFGLEPGKE